MVLSVTKTRSLMSEGYQLETAVQTLHDGGMILYPTDTIWGIGCDATNEVAVNNVFELKQRPKDKPFVILVSDVDMLKDYVAQLHPRIETLLNYHHRPLTIIYDQGICLAPNAISSNGSVAIRIPHDEYCQDLIRAFGKPIVASSANISNQPFPAHFGEVSSDVIMGVNYIEKYRQWDKKQREPSIIARLGEKDELEFLRS